MDEDLEVPLDEESGFTSLVSRTELVGRWAPFPLFSSWLWRLVLRFVFCGAGWYSFSSVWRSIGGLPSRSLGGLALLEINCGESPWNSGGTGWTVEL